jgi:hypothetical protein
LGIHNCAPGTRVSYWRPDTEGQLLEVSYIGQVTIQLTGVSY